VRGTVYGGTARATGVKDLRGNDRLAHPQPVTLANTTQLLSEQSTEAINLPKQVLGKVKIYI
jgi:hypothetical protein